LKIAQVLIEAFFYHKVVLVPWNIVSYNIFSGAGKGPDIFGTEPPDFYLRNLLLNFNVWTLLALAAGPIVLLQYLFRRHTSALGVFRSLILTSPFYMWLAIFSLQSHKEERFMYPAYPFLALNAAIALHAVLGWFGRTNPRSMIGLLPAQLKLAVVLCGILGAVIAGLLRTVGNITAYRAPLKVYGELDRILGAGAHTSVCLGKEWYRFPTSYFLPNDIHARFVNSEFRGLLPGQFSEAKTGFGLFPGTWLIPSGMNDQNIEDSSKYVCTLNLILAITHTTADSIGTMRLSRGLDATKSTTDRTRAGTYQRHPSLGTCALRTVSGRR
jgi:alpha-1,2-mannosyltransferase